MEVGGRKETERKADIMREGIERHEAIGSRVWMKMQKTKATGR